MKKACGKYAEKQKKIDVCIGKFKIPSNQGFTHNIMKRKIFLNAAAFAVVAVCNSQAALITGVTIQDSSSSNFGFNREDFRTVDGSGLSGLAHTNTASGNMWMTSTGGSDLSPEIIFDLGSVQMVESFRVWNYNEFLTDRGINGVVVTYGETLGGATASNPTGTDLSNILTEVTSFAEATGQNSYTGEEFTGFAPFSARFVKFRALGNHGSGDVSGLSEVQFFAADPIPEPSSVALLGLGAFALMMRRRK